MADHLAVLNMPLEALAKRSHTVTSFEPFTLRCPRWPCAPSTLGSSPPHRRRLICPTTARRLRSSLDHLSGALRAGWNIVTTSNPDAALNFGLEEHMEHDERYRRAREFYDVVTGLWDSLADGRYSRAMCHPVCFSTRRKLHALEQAKDSTIPCAGRSTSRVQCKAGR